MKKIYVIALALLGTACGQREMETRTFELHRLSDEQALNIITPYIQEGGSVSARERLITVRESKERLHDIERVLRMYDGFGEAADVILDIRIIEANGFTARDSAIADIEQTLSETFRYRGYRLAGRARIQTREGTLFSQTVGNGFHLSGAVQRIHTSGEGSRVPIGITLRGENSELKSTVTGIIGKPLVLGQSTGSGAIILVIQPSLAKP